MSDEKHITLRRVAEMLKRLADAYHDELRQPLNGNQMILWGSATELAKDALVAADSSPRSPVSTQNYELLYNQVMSLLRNTKMPHGLCEPRERKACTHCNAVEKLDELIANYKGARIVLANSDQRTSAPSGLAPEEKP